MIDTRSDPRAQYIPFDELMRMGNRFAEAFGRLDSGQKAALRRESPLSLQGFWTCMASARPADEVADGVEYALSHLVVLLAVDEQRFSPSGISVARAIPGLGHRRIEAILSEKRFPALIDQLDGAMTITKVSRRSNDQKVNFGHLLCDVHEFRRNPARLRRRWAKELFFPEVVRQEVEAPT